MEEETRGAVRARRTRSIQILTECLASQARANAEEGTPRGDMDGLDDVPLDHMASHRPFARTGEVVPAGVGVAFLGAALEEALLDGAGQPLITSFFSQSRRAT